MGAVGGSAAPARALSARRAAEARSAVRGPSRPGRVGDTYGHAAGDAVLCEVVRRVLAVMRPYDGFGRVGGEEFLVLAPGCGESELRVVLERIRGAVGSAPLVVDGHDLVVTMSLGGAMRGRESADGLIALADDALYSAKEQGRDRVVLAASDVVS